MTSKNLKKIEIVKNLSASSGFSLNFSKKVINDLIEIINTNIKSGNLNLKNIGSFKIINKKERIGRNPKTKEKFLISSRKSIIFSIIKKILEKLNKIV